MTSRRGVFSVFAALALVASACGPGGNGDGGSDESLASFFGYGDQSDPAEMEASWRDQEAQIQEAIRTCMAAEGFDYIPVQQPEGTFVVSGPEDELEQRETMGFGITTWFDDDGMTDDGMMDDGWQDPNQSIVEAMSETEREAYYEALWGDMEDMGELVIDEETGDEYYESMGFGGGCEGTAQEEFYGSQEDQQELWEQLEPAFDDLYQRIEADERMVKANAEYGSCMAEAGFDVSSQDDLWETVFEDMQARMDEIVGQDGMYADPFDGMSEAEIEAFFEESTEDEIDAFFNQTQQEALASVDREALDALKQEEIEIAVADYHCSQGSHELYEEIAADYEAEFIANNRDLLEQLRDAQG